MTTDIETKAEEVVVECEMSAPPETVWRAVTQEELVAEWLGVRPADEAQEPQHEMSYRIVEAQPFTRVRYAWRDPANPGAHPVVTIELEPAAGGSTKFRLTHGPAKAGAPALRAANTAPLALAA